jgi:hypothetical protein
MAALKAGSKNRVMIYYPCEGGGSEPDMRWAHDGERTIQGLMKFGADILPQGPFRHLASINQNVRVRAPALKNTQGKWVPVILTHGIGGTMSYFSTICKDLVSQGHVVFSLEHND